MNDTVAITVDPNEGAIIVPRAEAQEVYDKYLALRLTDTSDMDLFQALTVSLGNLPLPELRYSEGEQTFADRTLEKWRALGLK